MPLTKLAFFLAHVLSFPLWGAIASPARADYIHPTLAERSGTIMRWEIEPGRVLLVLEIDRSDADNFANLLAEGARETQFLQDGNGQPLVGTVRVLETRDRTPLAAHSAPAPRDIRGNPIALPELSPQVTYAEIDYPLAFQPNAIKLIPPTLDREKNAPEVTIGFIVFQQGIPLSSYWYLSQPETLDLDWDDPWYSRFENRNLTRPHQSSLTSYLYVEPYEVRHEVLIRVQDLDAWIDFDLGDREMLSAADLQQIQAQAIALFQQSPPTTIDGVAVEPVIDRAQFMAIDRRGTFQILQDPQELDVSAAILGLTLSYLTNGLPERIEMEWDEFFNERIQSIASQVTDPAGPFPYTLKPDDSVLVWQNFLTNYTLPTVEYLPVRRVRVPVGTVLGIIGAIATGLWLYRRRSRNIAQPYHYALPLGCLVLGIATYPIARVGIGSVALLINPVSETEARNILDRLLRNTYRAMEFREESAIYDRLAVSLDSDILTEIYLQNQRSLVLENEGGAIATVEDIEILEVSPVNREEGKGRLAFRTQWVASGTVGHWGHSHSRRNQYDAILTLAPIEDNWKIIDIELLEESRL